MKSLFRRTGSFGLVCVMMACSGDRMTNESNTESDLPGPDPSPWTNPVSPVESHGRLAAGNALHVVGHIGSDLVHRLSPDNGATWSSPTVIGRASGNFPMMYGGFHARGDTLYLLTAVGDMGPTAQPTNFRKSTDGGRTWTDPVRITAGGQELRRARIVAYENVVHVAGLGTETDGFVVYFRSEDDGATWEDGVKLVEGLGSYGGGQTLAVDRHTVHIPYTKVRAGVGGGDTYYIRSTDDGRTWSDPVLIGEQSESSDRQARVQVAAANGRVFVIWQREADMTGQPVPADRLGFNRSEDGGMTWLGPEVLPDDTGVNREHQQVWMTPQGEIHVVWWNGGRSVGYKSSGDFGDTWGPSEVPFAVGGGPVPFSVVLQGGRVHLLTGPQGSFQYSRRPAP